MKRSNISPTVAGIAMTIAFGVPNPATAESGNASSTTTSNASAFENLFTQSELVGKTLYDWGEQTIGQIEGVVHGSDGKLRAVLVDVGGFLGMGEKKVAVAIEQIRRSTDGGFIAADLTRQQAQDVPEYKPEEFEQSGR